MRKGDALSQERVGGKPPLPRVCLVGSLVGTNPGYITTTGDKWVPLLRDAGYSVVAVSHSPNRYVRLADIVGTLLRVRRSIDVIWLDVYAGRSFVVEDIASSIGVRSGVPIVMNVHSGYMPDFMARFPSWARRVLNRASCIVAPSDYLARTLRGYGFQPRVIPNVLDIEKYPYRHRSSVRPRLLWMRSFHPIWGPDIAVRVLKRLTARFPEATLVMGGRDKGLLPQTRDLAMELGVGGAVRFPGFLDMNAKRAEFDSSDIFINTNRIDNQPVAVVEACAMGLPVVATAVGGIPDLLRNEETGLLVPNEDVDGLALAVTRLVENPDLASRLSANGRILAARHAVGEVLPHWAEVLEALAARRPIKSW